MTTDHRPLRWLFLVHQLPPRPSNLRVRVWRRLQQVGAIVLRNSIYVLPNSPEAREDFDWIRGEISSRGGQVSILAGDVVDGYTEDQLIDEFRVSRTAEYDRLLSDLENASRRSSAEKRAPSRANSQRELGKLRQRLHAIKAQDYFAAPHGQEAQAALERFEKLLLDGPQTKARASRDARQFKRRTWLTRPRPGIDRMASAWLIRRFIDSGARFAFGRLPPAARQIPFDMPDVEFGHDGSHCTYETLMRRFGITDLAATRVGQVVHDLDLKDTQYQVPEAPAIGRLVDGLRDGIDDDQRLLTQGMQMIDALYRSYLRDDAAPHPDAPRTVREARTSRATARTRGRLRKSR